MALPETKALLGECDDCENMPLDYKLRLLAALHKEHVRTVQFIQRLRTDVEQTAASGNLEQASVKWIVLEKLLPHEAEFRSLVERLALEIQEGIPTDQNSKQAAKSTGKPTNFYQ